VEVSLHVPFEAAGTMIVRAIALNQDQQQAAEAEQVTVSIQQDAGVLLDELEIIDPVEYFFADDSTRTAFVLGAFSDGPKRDLSGSAAGTLYQTLDPAVVSVDCEGNMQAHAAGETTLVVANTFDGGVQVGLATLRVLSADPGWPPPPAIDDCNRNGLSDACEIASGFVPDVNGDGVPDPCAPPCEGDCAAPPNGVVGITDLLALLAQWGTAASCDLDGSGTVAIADLLQLLSNWGPCS
jgi:hypothetical protein